MTYVSSLDFSGDPVDYTVEADEILVLDSDANFELLNVEGTLQCLNEENRDFTLTTEGIVVNGPNALFECGTSTNKFEGKADFVLTGARNIQQDSTKPPITKGIVAKMGGTISLHGKSGKQGYVKLGTTALSSTNTLILSEARPGWEVNDEIVIAPSDFDPLEAEKRVIKSISEDALTVTLYKNLDYDHWGEPAQTFSNGKSGDLAKSWKLDESAEVANLTRNIKIRSDNSDYPQSISDINDNNVTGAHMMIMGMEMAGNAQISNVEFFRVGQMGQLGRYPFHWHLVGEKGDGQYLKDSSIHETYNRCVVVHGTNNTLVADNTCFNHFGHGYFLEDGNEVNNNLTGNIGILSKRVPRGRHLLISEVSTPTALKSRFAAPSTFWIANPKNTVKNNVAASSEGTGFWMAFQEALYCDSSRCTLPSKDTRDSNGKIIVKKRLTYEEKCGAGVVAVPQEANVFPSTEPTPRQSFDGNIAHSSMVGITHDGAPNGPPLCNPINPADRELKQAFYDPSEVPTFNKLVAYKNFETGIYYRGDNEGSQAIYNDTVLADNSKNAWFAYDQELHQSLIVGRSANHSNESYDKLIEISRRDGNLPNNEEHLIVERKELGVIGVRIYDGPFTLSNIHFAEFSSSEENYLGRDSTAIAIRRMGAAERFLSNSSEQISFANIDGTEPAFKLDFSRPFDLADTLGSDTDFLGSAGWGDLFTANLVDKDGSLSGQQNQLLVPDSDFNNDTQTCTKSPDSLGLHKVLLCDHEIAILRLIRLPDSNTPDAPAELLKHNITVSRIKSGSEDITIKSDHFNAFNKFPMILDRDYRYEISGLDIGAHQQYKLDFISTQSGPNSQSPVVSINGISNECNVLQISGGMNEANSLGDLADRGSGFYSNGNFNGYYREGTTLHIVMHAYSNANSKLGKTEYRVECL